MPAAKRTAEVKRLAKRPDRPGSQRRYDAKRQEVVDIAAHVFAQRGYHATSIDDLVEATGLQRGGLYHYIDSKEDLLIAIHERFIEPLLANATAIVEEDVGAEEALRMLAHALMNDIANYRDQVTVFLHEWRAIERGSAWKGIRRSRRRFEQIIESVLARGTEEGVFAVDNPRLTTLAFLGMINYSYQWYNARGPHSPDEIAAQFADMFLSGILVSGSKRKATTAKTRGRSAPSG